MSFLKITHKQTTKQLGFSDSTIEKWRKDTQMDSSQNRGRTKKRAPKDRLRPPPV